MNKALIAVLMLCIIGGSAAFTMNAEKCFTQAAAFSHQVKGIIAAVSVSPISISKLLGASYDTFETVNPLIQGCGFDLPLLDQYASYKPANASKCFTDLEQLTNIALELKAASDASKDLSKNIFEILPKVLEAFKIYNQAKIDCEIVSKEQTPLLSSNGFDANIFKCISEAQTTLTDAKKFIADSKADVLPMEDIFEEGINVYNEVVVLLRDCGAQKIALPTVNNVAELKNCAKDIKNTVSSIEKTLVALKERKFTELFTDAKNVYAAIISDVAECPKKSLLSSSDIFACIADGVSISKDLKKFVESAKSKNTKDIVIGAYTVLGQLGPLAKDCDLNLNIDIPKFNPADLENCAANTDGLVNTIQQLASDVSGKKLWNIVSDVTSAVSQLKSIVNFCKNTHAMLSVSADPLSCISHAKKLYEEVNVLIENSKTNNVPEIVFGAYTIVESLQPLVNECGLKFDLHIPTITFPDLKGCVVDTQSLINNFKTIRDDYKEKNYLKIFDDAAEVVKTLQNVAVICKPNQALQTGIDILTCINDAKSLYSNVDKLVADSKNKAPVNEIVVLAYNTVQSLQPLIDACGLKVDLHIPAITFPDLNGCVIDASGLVDTVKAIKDDVKSKKIENIFDHVAAAVIALQDIATKCKPQKALLSFNILKCFQSGQKVYSDVKNFVDLNKDSKPLNEVVVAAFNIIKELQPFVNDCDLKIDLHIPDIDFNDLNGCVADSSSIVNDFKTLAQQLKDKDYISIIGTIQSAISAIKSVADECKVHKNAKFVLQANILTCAKESQLMLKRASALIAEYKSKQVADVVVTAYDMVENLQTLVDACVPKQVNLHIPKITFVNLKQCVVDVQTVISIVNTIKNDVKVKNWNKIITDSKSVIASFQQIKSHCSASKKVLEAVDPSKIIACLSTSKKVYEDVKTFVDINKDKRPINEIVVHAFGLIEEIQPLFNTCGIKADLHIPQIDFNDLNGCVVDGQKIVDTVKSLLADLKAKNFINLVSDVQTVIQASKNVATECKTQKKPALEASLNIHCISNLGKVAKDAFSVYQKLKNSSDVVDELLTIQGFLTDLQPACDSCGIKVNIPTIPSEGKVIATVECVADVTKAVESIGALYANATSLNVIGAYSDIKTIISSVTDANQKCRQIKQTAI